MRILRLLKEILLGICCINCQTPGPELCSICIAKFQRIDFPFCLYCDELSIDGKTHKRCLRYSTLYQHTSSYIYTTGIRKLILNIKLSHRGFYSLNILFNSDTFKNSIESILNGIDIIIPFPKTPKYLDKDEINFVDLLIQALIKNRDIHIVDLLYKTTTIKQKSRTKYSREDIKKEISYRQEYVKFIKGKTILIVDDVTTTGASLIVAANILKHLGAHTVKSYAFAKDMRYN